MSEKASDGQWAIVELMGHKVVAGYASKSEMFGDPLLRIDVPETSTCAEFTQFYGLGAVYCITPVGESVARLTAESCKINPVSVYVPELITVESHKEIVAQLEKQIGRLRNTKALPEHIYADDDHSDDETFWQTD